jgi:SAM-dependent methyltransferase
VSDSTYFAAAQDHAPEVGRLSLLETIFDPGTIEMLTNTGVGPGWTCLVPGAGHGSIARWLAERVEPGGHVVATDIDTRFLESSVSPSLEVREHDLLGDPIASDAFDLVHARYLLAHLVGNQQRAVDRLVSSVRVGGWLALEETDPVLASADLRYPREEMFNKAMKAALEVATHHVDLMAGRHVASLLIANPNLRVVDIDIRTTIERGASPHAQFVAQTTGVVVSQMADVSDLSADVLQAFSDALLDPSFLFVSEMRYRMMAQKVDPA